MSIAQGKDAWGELILLGIGLIPGGRLLGLAVKGVDLVARAGSIGARAASLIRLSASAVGRFGSAGVSMVFSTLNRAADAALPRLMPVLRSGASAAIQRLDSLMNPKWVSQFAKDPTAAALHELPGSGAHPGGGGGAGTDSNMLTGPPRDPAVVAAEHAQTSSGYQADVWTGVDLPAGQHIAMGLNVRADFTPYTDIAPTTMPGFAMSVDHPASLDFGKDAVWQSLQVEKNVDYGYRGVVGFFESTVPTHAAEGVALANDVKVDANGVLQSLGQGGAPQTFHPDFMESVDRGDWIPTDVHRNPLPYTVSRDESGAVTGLAILVSRDQHVIHLF
jgi:hypothetical protein